ncbi:MAG: HNH endonuclease [Acidobacteria bacterium]|nr:HNH endonuclease [Acidobacteriota bacterium]
MSRARWQPGGWADPKRISRGPNGRALCRWCGTEVRPPRRTFCGETCVHHWRMRTSPAYVREQVFRRDRGVCALCGEDTMARSRSLRKLPWRARRRRCQELGIPYLRLRSPWDADHIVPVCEGGGQCSLENFRTLCIPCHQRVTGELRVRLRSSCATTEAANSRGHAPSTLGADM